MRYPTIVVLLVLGLAACGGQDADPADTTPVPEPEPVVAGVDWTGHGIRFKYPEGMFVKVREVPGRFEVSVTENPEKRSSVSVSLHIVPGTPVPGAADLHRKTAAAGTRASLEKAGAEFAADGEVEREIAGKTRKGTVLECDFGPAHYRLEMFSIDLGTCLVGVVLRHEPHEKEIALKAFTTMAKTLAAAPK